MDVLPPMMAGSPLPDKPREHDVACVPVIEADIYAARTGLDPTQASSRMLLSQQQMVKPSHLFAVARQWDLHTQTHMDMVLSELIKRNCHVDDVDAASGCSPIHFAAKAGAAGIGDDAKAAELVKALIRRGADANKVCTYLKMTPLQYAAYFGCFMVVDVLLHSSSSTGQVDINRTTPTMGNASALHLAVMNIHPKVVELLLRSFANTELKDDAGRTPLDVAKAMLEAPGSDDNVDDIRKIIRMLEEASGAAVSVDPVFMRQPHDDQPSAGARSGANLLNVDSVTDVGSSIAPDDDTVIEVGDRVRVKGRGEGIVRFKGETKFKPGRTWYGVQLDDPKGKNNGTVQDIEYFRCKPNHGVFVRRSLLAFISSRPTSSMSRSSARSRSSKSSPTPIRRQRPPSDKKPSRPRLNKAPEMQKPRSPLTMSPFGPMIDPFGLHSRVLCHDMMGVVLYIGECHLGEGPYIGVEIGKGGKGEHNGMVDGKRYFKCKPGQGLLVPAKEVTWHGHNVAKVLRQLQFNLATDRDLKNAK